MSTVATKLMTADEFYDFCHLPQNRDRHFELVKGEVEEMSRPGEKHGVVCGNGTGLLWTYARKRKKGHVCPNDTGLVLERDPDTVRGADIAFYWESRRFDELAPKYADRLPDLAVEVLSPRDRMARMLRRIKLFLDKGVKLVWLIDPDAHCLTVYRAGRKPIVLHADDEVTGEEVLPGFRCKVLDFFAMAAD